ncbi:2-succinyl-5-enolpyruvyl-6-hydroxy-3-cyclohexene-1-carboxylic-acid synthase [Kamptonema animale CS-326]|jgi:2-succinyl-5-enolpyruvyl-6-hydroxy-3-cyclohexene-1-carboxylate synthase|uniref:2-succinyl-5-enolpyruvyl-6-hydroxy-3- cyclohexene-1-carboxylic-acid synthase n=1 Tax=Kamptonema animale TaxID=92934 RepID=UPI00232FACA2|nr:2-succinyl-5-enolpyruvyl-6-hydroxy-3-cyclohexene-1-carboxylic-acid synthase [Kamptonema animale]MDB9509633.1 2-succinyl-5-enolpyruvyl-6-hydroxy-3-cyclohexene-1-carboxylic-acid synthase [Kamptonema animale CS-326]
MIDFRNTNTLWSSILVETWQRLGLNTAIICPGSRSTPLTIAFAQNSKVETIPILDERSAAFFALGIAKKTGFPVAVVCTSGTASANFFPAIIEAKESKNSLLILTADRPPEMRECHAGQAIDQVKLYGNYPNWQTELALPSAETGMLNYLRQTAIHAWEQALFPVPGPVHLNIPFREPLAPIPELATTALQAKFSPENFFDCCHFLPGNSEEYGRKISPKVESFLTDLFAQKYHKILIIAGIAQPQFPEIYCHAVAQISKSLGAPVLAEGLSPLRNYSQLNPALISTYDLILRHPEIAQKLTPDLVIQLGELPISKNLRTWLEDTQPRRWIIDPSDRNFDPLHGKTSHLRTSVEFIASILFERKFTESSSTNEYLQLWCNTEAKIRTAIDQKMNTINNIVEPKAAWLISQILPTATPIFIANSMPVRDVEFFWVPNNLNIQPFFNRGANGIDGTLSTALGIAYRNQSSVLLTGDLALLHDTNGFLLTNKFVGHLTIILINNNGGGIFEMLPIAKFEPTFEEFFATPQNINFSQLCATYGVEHEIINSWEQLKQRLNPLPSSGIRALELQTNRREDAQWRKDNLSKFSYS